MAAVPLKGVSGILHGGVILLWVHSGFKYIARTLGDRTESGVQENKLSISFLMLK